MFNSIWCNKPHPAVIRWVGFFVLFSGLSLYNAFMMRVRFLFVVCLIPVLGGVFARGSSLDSVEDIIFDKANFPNVKTGVHYLTRIYLAEAKKDQEIKLDETQERYLWIDKKWHEENKDTLHHYVLKHIKDSGVFD